jgi:hypothetical protein
MPKFNKALNKRMKTWKAKFFLFSLVSLYHSKIFALEIDTEKFKCIDFLKTHPLHEKGYPAEKLLSFIERMPNPRESPQGFSFGPLLALPLQGWKLHVSFPKDYPLIVVESVVPFLIKNFPDLAFKVPHTLSFERGFGNKENSQYGKLITIYPKDTAEFHKVTEALKPLLKNLEKTYGSFIEPNAKGDIPTDSTGVFARYGRFTPSLKLGDNEIIRVNKDGNALNANGHVIQYKGSSVNLTELNLNLRPQSIQEKEESNELYNHLRKEGAIEQDDRSQTPSWAKVFIDASP